MLQPTHIALVTTSYPDASIQPGKDAAGSFVADFAATLAQKGRVTVIAPSHAQSVEEQGALRVLRFGAPRLPLSLLSPAKPTDWWAILKTMMGGAQTLDRLCQQEKVDHIFALWALPSGYWAQQQWRRRRIPYSVWALGSDIWTLGKMPLVRSLLHSVLRESHACFADGYELMQQTVLAGDGKVCGFLPSSRRLPPIPERRFASEPPYRLAFLGRWHPNKGIDLLLDALTLLDKPAWQRITEVRIAGGGPLEEIVRSKVAGLQEAGRNVNLLGYLDKGAAVQLFSWADYVLLPSRIESIPVVFSDAMHCRAPIISTPVGDLQRLIEGYHVGVVAEAVNVEAYAKALRHALFRTPQDFASKLERTATDFSVEGAVEKFWDAL